MTERPDPRPRPAPPPPGLCETCRYSRRIESRRGGVYQLCERSATDPSYPRYPALPVLHCRGFDPLVDTR